MPLNDIDLIALLDEAAKALDAEAAYLIDVDIDDRGRQRPSVPAGDRDFFDAVTDQARGLRELVEMVRSRTR